MIAAALRDAGLEANVVEDLSTAGIWLGGVVGEIYKPQVWIEREDVERAKPVLDEFERQAMERRRAAANAPDIEVLCEECGTRSLFPGNQFGSVQNCLHCRAFVDVGDEVLFDGWDEAADNE
jgi:hypothetical protein